jgi:hypothetical protein
MDSYTIPVAPAAPQTDIEASLKDLQTQAALFYAGADIVWVLMSSGLVLLMVPGMCLFYSGESRRDMSLLLFRMPLITTAFVGFLVSCCSYITLFLAQLAVSATMPVRLLVAEVLPCPER